MNNLFVQYVPHILRDILTLKIIHCSPEIEIFLDVLYLSLGSY